MFTRIIKRQGESIFELERRNNRLTNENDILKQEKEQMSNLLNKANTMIESCIMSLYDIQEINVMGIDTGEKQKHINLIINKLGMELIKIKNELPRQSS